MQIKAYFTIVCKINLLPSSSYSVILLQILCVIRNHLKTENYKFDSLLLLPILYYFQASNLSNIVLKIEK